MEQYGFFVNTDICTGCKACMIACIDKHNLNKGVLWRRVLEYSGGEWLPVGDAYEQNVFAYYVSLSCNHCDDPACTKVCPTGASYVADDGTVQIDAENYREKREESLERLAQKVAGKVIKYRRNVTLEPMNAYERHVIHTALQDTQYITTFSIGTEPNRRVVVSYDRTKQ